MPTTLISELESLQATAPALMDAGLVFSGKASGRLIQGYAKATAYTPIIDLNYLFHESSRDIIVWLMCPHQSRADPLYVFGPTGCGKTSCIKQLAARLNYPVFEVPGHGRLEFADLTGHLAVKDGNMVYEYGPLALAMRYGGVLLLNEIDLTSPEVAAGLNTVLDGSPLCIAENGGELIAPHPMFRFVATANTNGGGDNTGLYQGTQRQNIAWLDRFVLCETGYPTPDVEKALLAQRFPVLPEDISHKLVEFAGEVRKLFMGAGGEADSGNLSGAIEVTLSTRTLLRWAELTIRFQPLAHQGIQPVTYALDRALGFRASRETRAMLHELAQRVFPQNWPQNWPQREDFTASYTSPSEIDDISFLQQGLYPLLGSDLSKLPTLPFIHLDKPTPSGGKFWGATMTPHGLALNWGRSGTSGQKIHLEETTCNNHDPIQEMHDRTIKKLREGYALNRNSTFIPKENA